MVAKEGTKGGVRRCHAGYGLGLLLWLLAGCAPAPESASAGAEPPPGPPLDVPVEELAAALQCTPDIAAATRPPVLITPAFSTAEQSFSGYLAQLPALGIPTCSLTLPDNGFDDLQTAAEFVVHAVREIHDLSGQKVLLFGHQHGPLDQLWALTFWPDIAPKVSSLISLATPYQGTSTASGFCTLGRRCSEATWQIAAGSAFTGALLSRPLPEGVAITSITTLFDPLITPQPAASSREGVQTLVLQDICPGRLVEHFTILMDNLAYALVLDAIEHPGEQADPARLPTDICAGPRNMPTPPGSPGPFDGGPGFFIEFPLNTLGGVSAEPALREYAQEP